MKLGDGQTAIVTDTVGFIHKLPHQLVDAFRATLEEVNRADVLVEVVDASDPHIDEHRATVQTVLDELGAGDKPRLVVFNKADLIDPAALNGERVAPSIAGAVFVSALTGYGMETLRAEIAAVLASLVGRRRCGAARTLRASSWPASASAVRSISSTASVTCASTAASRRPRRRAGGGRPALVRCHGRARPEAGRGRAPGSLTGRRRGGNDPRPSRRSCEDTARRSHHVDAGGGRPRDPLARVDRA